MRKLFVVSITGAWLILFALSTVAAQNDYSGTWVLDKGSQKIVPKNFVNYTMVVKQNGNQLVVMTKPGGVVDTSEQGSGSNSTLQSLQNESNAQSEGSKSANGGSVRSGGTMGESAPGSNAPGAMALQMVFAEASYTIDGNKTTANISGLGNAEFTAKWSRGGKSLDISIAHEPGSDSQAAAAFHSKERWTLSEDGQTLKLQRSVSTQVASDNIVLVFRRKAAQ